jgi:hypothetical protein
MQYARTCTVLFQELVWIDVPAHPKNAQFGSASTAGAIVYYRRDDYFAHAWRRGSVQLDAEAGEGLVLRPGSLAASRSS